MILTTIGAYVSPPGGVVAYAVVNRGLTLVGGALQVIGGRMPDSSRDKPVIGDIVARLDSLNDIVHDLLVFARPREPQLGPVPRASLLESTLALLRRDPALGSSRATTRSRRAFPLSPRR